MLRQTLRHEKEDNIMETTASTKATIRLPLITATAAGVVIAGTRTTSRASKMIIHMTVGTKSTIRSRATKTDTTVVIAITDTKTTVDTMIDTTKAKTTATGTVEAITIGQGTTKDHGTTVVEGDIVVIIEVGETAETMARGKEGIEEETTTTVTEEGATRVARGHETTTMIVITGGNCSNRNLFSQMVCPTRICTLLCRLRNFSCIQVVRIS